MPKRPKGSIPAEIHAVVVREFERVGVVPPATALAKITGISPNLVRRALRLLLDKEILVQPYGDKSAYVPTCNTDGKTVKVRLEELDFFVDIDYQ